MIKMENAGTSEFFGSRISQSQILAPNIPDWDSEVRNRNGLIQTDNAFMKVIVVWLSRKHRLRTV